MQRSGVRSSSSPPMETSAWHAADGKGWLWTGGLLHDVLYGHAGREGVSWSAADNVDETIQARQRIGIPATGYSVIHASSPVAKTTCLFIHLQREPSFSLDAELTHVQGQRQELRCIDRQRCALYIALCVTTVPPEQPTAMSNQKPTVQGLTPGHEVMTRQRLPYFIGISGRTVNATGLSMHLVVIPPGARAEPHIHVGYETGIYVLEGTVCTRWGPALEHEVVSQAGDFLFVPPGVPHEAINLSATEPARAVVARNHPAEQDRVEPFVPEPTSKPGAQEQ